MANTKKTTTTKKATPKKDKEVVVEKTEKVEKKTLPPLQDTDEIEVEALIPNVSYKSNRTEDMYEWKDVGDIELMPYEEIKNMWRNYKGYFKNLWLRPKDDRVIDALKIRKLFDNYDLLLNKDVYLSGDVDEVIKTFGTVSSGLKTSVISFIRSLVDNGELTNIRTIRTLEKHLGLDLVSLLD